MFFCNAILHRAWIKHFQTETSKVSKNDIRQKMIWYIKRGKKERKSRKYERFWPHSERGTLERLYTCVQFTVETKFRNWEWSEPWWLEDLLNADSDLSYMDTKNWLGRLYFMLSTIDLFRQCASTDRLRIPNKTRVMLTTKYPYSNDTWHIP